MNVKEMNIGLNFKLPKKYQSAVILSPKKNVFIFPVKGYGSLYPEPSPPHLSLLANHIRL